MRCILKRAGRPSVGIDAEHILPVNLQQISNPLEHPRQFRVDHCIVSAMTGSCIRAIGPPGAKPHTSRLLQHSVQTQHHFGPQPGALCPKNGLHPPAIVATWSDLRQDVRTESTSITDVAATTDAVSGGILSPVCIGLNADAEMSVSHSFGGRLCRVVGRLRADGAKRTPRGLWLQIIRQRPVVGTNQVFKTTPGWIYIAQARVIQCPVGQFGDPSRAPYGVSI